MLFRSRAMGKKKKEILDKEYAGFAQGMKDNGYSAAACVVEMVGRP